ncbi:MAG TPA: hypothetical protein VNG89_20550 [Vicinamibacterales bacterium]|nr:hypothetical protein [Vicinamibacterales bacterium]
MSLQAGTRLGPYEIVSALSVCGRPDGQRFLLNLVEHRANPAHST